MMQLIGIMTGCFAGMTLLALGVFRIIGMQYLPTFFWLIPTFFLILTLTIGLIARKYTNLNKPLSIGTILGIRFLFINLIAIFIIVNMLIDKAHIVSFTITSVVYATVFSYLETRILLYVNKKTIENKKSNDL